MEEQTSYTRSPSACDPRSARRLTTLDRIVRTAALAGALLVAASAGCHEATPPRPDRIGDALLFESDRDGQWDIYAISVRTLRVWRLTDHPRDDYSPAWGPSREWIAFVSERDSPGDEVASEVYVMRADGSGLRRITTTGTATGSPSWSPTGNQLIYGSAVGGGTMISIIGVDGAGAHAITEGTHHDFDPAWSPDGETIAFVSNRLDTPTLWLMSPTGMATRRLGDLDYVSRPTWSPDGTRIAVTSNRAIYVIDVATEIARRLSLETEEARRPVWSPDGSAIAYSSDRFGTTDILVVDAATGALRQRLTQTQFTDLTGSWSRR